MLRSAQIWKKCTIFGNLRTITQEGKNETRQRTPFFSSTSWVLTVCDIHFCIWKMSKFVFLESPLWSFWSVKYVNFGGESCEIRILSRLIQETYTLRKVKNQVFLFKSSWEPNLSDLMVYHSHKKWKDGNTGCAVDIFAWTWNIWGVRTEHTSKQRKMVTFVRNYLMKMSLRLF